MISSLLFCERTKRLCRLSFWSVCGSRQNRNLPKLLCLALKFEGCRSFENKKLPKRHAISVSYNASIFSIQFSFYSSLGMDEEASTFVSVISSFSPAASVLVTSFGSSFVAGSSFADSYPSFASSAIAGSSGGSSIPAVSAVSAGGSAVSAGGSFVSAVSVGSCSVAAVSDGGSSVSAVSVGGSSVSALSAGGSSLTSASVDSSTAGVSCFSEIASRSVFDSCSLVSSSFSILVSGAVSSAFFASSLAPTFL
mmetsp:Transcript_3805/g.5571  ORF Transcript_3805/g.5571 Transcript_3805/m.5571 type:complete len:252 (-) Transcript_3805:1065-1820(-)